VVLRQRKLPVGRTHHTTGRTQNTILKIAPQTGTILNIIGKTVSTITTQKMGFTIIAAIALGMKQ
jgi:hypothetical protein